MIADNTIGCTDAETLLVRRGLRRAPATPVRAGRTDANCQPTFITNEWSLVRIEGETALLRLENAVAGGPPVLLYVLKTEVVGPDGRPPS